MSNKIFWFVGGGIIGAIAGFFFGGTLCANRYKDRIKDLEDWNKELIEELDGKEEDEEKALQHFEDIRREEYSKMAKAYVRANSTANVTSNETEDIYVITEQEFKDDLNYRDNETVTWYVEDGILIDSADMPIHNEEETIGMEALGELENSENSDQEYVYVSNDIENKMYEIIIERNISYYRDLMGIGDLGSDEVGED